MSEIDNKFLVNTGVYRAETVVIEFADGEYAVPAPFVAQSGGAQVLKDNAKDLRQITFEQFVKGCNRAATRSSLQTLQQTIIAQHLRSFR